MTLRIPMTLILLTALGGAVSVALAALPVVSRYNAADDILTAATTPLQAAAPPRLDVTPILDFAPFGRSATAVTASAAPSSLTLQGVSVSPDTQSSRAIIAGGISDSSSYAIGDTVVQGTTLTQITTDHITLTNDVGPQRLDFPGSSAQTAEAPAFSTKLQNLMPVAQPTSPSVTSLRDQLKLNPRAVLEDYAITETPDGYLIGDSNFTQFGLQMGDVVTQINGQAVGDITADRGFLDEVASSGKATLLVDRAGQMSSLQVTLP